MPGDLDPDDLEADDAFGHPVLREQTVDDGPWADGDDDDVDV